MRQTLLQGGGVLELGDALGPQVGKLEEGVVEHLLLWGGRWG
jgi:hypothetical protein